MCKWLYICIQVYECVNNSVWNKTGLQNVCIGIVDSLVPGLLCPHTFGTTAHTLSAFGFVVSVVAVFPPCIHLRQKKHTLFYMLSQSVFPLLFPWPFYRRIASIPFCLIMQWWQIVLEIPLLFSFFFMLLSFCFIILMWKNLNLIIDWRRNHDKWPFKSMTFVTIPRIVLYKQFA